MWILSTTLSAVRSGVIWRTLVPCSCLPRATGTSLPSTTSVPTATTSRHRTTMPAMRGMCSSVRATSARTTAAIGALVSRCDWFARPSNYFSVPQNANHSGLSSAALKNNRKYLFCHRFLLSLQRKKLKTNKNVCKCITNSG